MNTARRRLLAGLGALPLCRPLRAESRSVIYSWPASMLADARSVLPIVLLERAIRLSGAGFELRPADRELTQSRGLRHLALGRSDVDVVWTFTSQAREATLLPIRIPLDRGLLGWRLLLVRRAESRRLAALPDADALRAERCAQGHDWPDFDVLRDNGFRILAAPTYDALFDMLSRGRVTHVPRGAGEIWPEIETHADKDLAVAEDWVLHYPAPLYFFVSPQRPQLAAAIEEGLEQMLQDGSFQDLFRQRYGASLQRAGLGNRRVIALTNHQLPPGTPLQRSELWLSPDEAAG